MFGLQAANLPLYSQGASEGSFASTDFHHVAARTAIAAVIGGTVSEIGGGTFANGAVTAAMQHLFNADSASYYIKKHIGEFFSDWGDSVQTDMSGYSHERGIAALSEVSLQTGRASSVALIAGQAPASGVLGLVSLGSGGAATFYDFVVNGLGDMNHAGAVGFAADFGNHKASALLVNAAPGPLKAPARIGMDAVNRVQQELINYSAR